MRGEVLEVYPPYDDFVLRLEFFGDELERVVRLEPLTGEILEELHSGHHLPGPLLRHPH